MTELQTYLTGLSGPEKLAIIHVYDTARAVAGQTEDGVSYGMPCLLYHGKALISIMQTKTHLALYPFSGKVVSAVADKLGGYSLSSGTIRFSADKPLPEAIVEKVIKLRMHEIDASLVK